MATQVTDSNITDKNTFLQEHPAIAKMPENQYEWNAFIQTLQRWVKDQEYSLTLSATGFSSDPVSVGASVHRYGKLVVLSLNSISATSDAANFDISSIPSDLRPASSQFVSAAGFIDNGVGVPAGVQLTAGGGTLQVWYQNGDNWTTSGTKGCLSGTTIVYSLFDADLTK